MISASVFLWLLTVGFALAYFKTVKKDVWELSGFLAAGIFVGLICSVTMTVVAMVQLLP